MDYPLDSKLLHVFCKVVELKNMTSAAKALYLTSSAISHSLRKLEIELGVSLLDRNPRKLVMTSAGQKLYNLSRPLLVELKKIRSEINDFEELNNSIIRVGTNSALNLYGFPKTLITLREHYPKIIVQVVCHSESVLQNMYDSKEIDLLFLPSLEHYNESETGKKMLGYDQINLFFKQAQNCGTEDNYTTNLANQTIILEEALKKDFSKIVRKELTHPLGKVKNFLFLNGEEGIKRYVQTGLGIGMLPYWIVSKDVNNGKLKPFSVETSPIKRFWHYQFLKEKNVEPLIETLKRELSELPSFQVV